MEAASRRPSGAQDAAAIAWWLLVGTAAGAIAGLVVGGVGGRLAMLLLRLTSPESVIGLTSDDGFEIGVVTTDTLALLLGLAFLGGLNGVAYVTLRGAIPVRLRLPLWTLLSGALAGGQIVHEDGVDFTLLEPAGLAVLLFVLIPAAAAAVVVMLVERWIVLELAEHRRLAAGLAVAACAGTLALVPAAVVGAGALALRRLDRVARLVQRLAGVAVPAGIAVVTVTAGIGLIREIVAIV